MNEVLPLKRLRQFIVMHNCEQEPLSFGWVFIILVSIGTTIYCGVGIGYKMHKYGVRGAEVWPQLRLLD